MREQQKELILLNAWLEENSLIFESEVKAARWIRRNWENSGLVRLNKNVYLCDKAVLDTCYRVWYDKRAIKSNKRRKRKEN